MGEDEDVLGFDVSVDIVPVSLNYQYEWALGDCLSWYLGAGIGMGNELGDVVGILDAIVAEDVTEVPEFLDDVEGGGHGEKFVSGKGSVFREEA
jgi:hypothetical protein